MIPIRRFLEDQQIFDRPDNPQNPLVTVILPAYKLREGGMNQRAIESVLGQTFRDFEFIIVDDGSLEGLFQLLCSYQEKDARIRLIRHDTNSGLHSIRLNESLVLAKGKYIAYMFEDDQWYPHALESMLDTMNRSGGYGLVYGAVDWEILRPDGRVETRRLGEWDFNFAVLRDANRIAHCGVLHSRSVLDQCGLYDPNILLRRLCDFDLWLRMGKYAPFYRCHEVIGKVVSGTRHTLGANIDQDISVVYRYISTDRDEALKAENIADYRVDTIPFATTPEEAFRIRERHFIPFWVQHPAYLTPSERKRAVTNRMLPNRLLVTKPAYSTSVDVTLTNFDSTLPAGLQSFSFMSEANLPAADPHTFDTLILYRTIGTNSINKMRDAQQRGIPVIYMLDDNMFRFGEGYTASEFSYLQPGSAGLQGVERGVAGADLTISYSEQISADCARYTQRIFELSTNIKEQYIRNSAPLPGGKETGRRLRYGVISGSARRREIQELWPQWEKFFNQHKDEVEFHMWGMDPAEFGPLECPVFTRPFDHSYASYLNALSTQRFDFVLSPLFDDHDTKTSKSPIKYLETTASGAAGIYSESKVYTTVTDGVTGFKVPGNGDWYAMLERTFQMSDEQRAAVHAAAREHMLREYVTEIQSLRYLTAFETASLHAALCSRDVEGQKAAIAYFFHESMLGGATLHLMQHALIAQELHFRPILCFPKQRVLTQEVQDFAAQHEMDLFHMEFSSSNWKREANPTEVERAKELAVWMKDQQVRMVHMINYDPDVALAAEQLGLPLVATLHQHFAPPKDQPYKGPPPHLAPRRIAAIHSSSLRYAQMWETEFATPALCIRAPIGEKYFDTFAERVKRPLPAVPTLLVSGTIQQRKGQLEAIQAVGMLAKKGIKVRLVLLGYDNLAVDYVARCRQAVETLELQDVVSIPGFISEPQRYYDDTDFILCSSDFESMPQSILKAMASGIRVITTPCGGVKELVLDGFTGILTDGYTAEDIAAAIERSIGLTPEHWNTMLRNAHAAATMSCAREVVTYQLMKLYNLAVSEKAAAGSTLTVPENQPAVARAAALPAANPSGNGSQPVLAEPLEMFVRRIPPHGLVYKMRVPQDHWDTLYVTFATFGQTNRRAVDVLIRLARFPFQVLRKVRIPANLVLDNASVPITFLPIADIADQDVLVHITTVGFDIPPRLAVYELGHNPPRWKKAVNLINPAGGNLINMLTYVRLPGSKD